MRVPFYVTLLGVAQLIFQYLCFCVIIMASRKHGKVKVIGSTVDTYLGYMYLKWNMTTSVSRAERHLRWANPPTISGSWHDYDT